MTHAVALSEPAEKLFHLHMLHFHRDGRVAVGSFERPLGYDLHEVETAYAELIAAGMMHVGRLPDGDDPGTYVLSSRALYPDGGIA